VLSKEGDGSPTHIYMVQHAFSYFSNTSMLLMIPGLAYLCVYVDCFSNCSYIQHWTSQIIALDMGRERSCVHARALCIEESEEFCGGMVQVVLDSAGRSGGFSGVWPGLRTIVEGGNDIFVSCWFMVRGRKLNKCNAPLECGLHAVRWNVVDGIRARVATCCQAA
jgi:hypothetical protein